MESDFNLGFDIKRIVFKGLKYWYLLIAAIIISYSLSFLYLRYQNQTFKVRAKLLIRDDNMLSNSNSIIDELMLPSGLKNIKNEMAYLQSYDLVMSAILNLDFHVTYLEKGELKDSEKYSTTSPYTIEIDSNLYLPHATFQLIPKDEGSFELICQQEYPISVFEYKSGEKITSYPNKFGKKQVFHFGQPIVLGDSCVFKVKKNNLIPFTNSEDTKYLFCFEKLDRNVRYYLGSINIYPEDKKMESSVINLEHVNSNIPKSTVYLNMLVNEFIRMDLEEKNKIIDNSLSFITRELNVVLADLGGVEDKLEELRNSSLLIDLEHTSERAYDKLVEYDRAKSVYQLQIKYFKSVYDYLAANYSVDSIVAPSSVGIDDQLLSTLMVELRGLYSKKAALSISSTKNSPTIETINHQIKNVRLSLMELLRNMIKSSEIQLVDLNKKINENSQMIKNLPRNERDFLRIKRSYDLNKNLYDFLVEKRASAGIARSLNCPDNKILDYARLVSYRPLSPNVSKIRVFFIVIGLLIFVAFVYLKEFLFEKISSVEHLNRISNVGIVGFIGHNKEKGLPIIDQPKSAISESFRAMRIELESKLMSRNHQVLGFTSSISGEGKTFCSTNIGVSFAKNNLKVLIVGADLRKPKLGEDLNVSRDVGLSNYLSDENINLELIIKSTSVTSLDIITSGPIPPNPSEMLSNKKFVDLIEILKTKYDRIIIDCSPVGLVADYFVLGHLVDFHVFVLRNNYTRVVAKELIERFSEKYGSQNVGLLLNDIHQGFYGGYSYKYGYSYGYGYGAYYETDIKN